jgi:hypothetical protein
MEYLDEGGYPTEAALNIIREWSDPWPSIMKFIKEIWWMPEWGWHEVDEKGITTYYISTGGWSGNESIIEAMRNNTIFWMMYWYSSRVGGHYSFKDYPGLTKRRAKELEDG